MVGLFRWLTMLTWLIWFVFYWGAGTRSFITYVSHSSELDRISMLIMAVGALGLFGSMVLVLLGIVTLPQNEVVVLIRCGAGVRRRRRFVLLPARPGAFLDRAHGPSGEPRDHRQRPLRHGAPSHLHGDAGVLPGDDVGILCVVDWGAVDALAGGLRAEGAGRGAVLGR